MRVFRVQWGSVRVSGAQWRSVGGVRGFQCAISIHPVILMKNVTQITISHDVSKDFLRLHFAVVQVLLISGYDSVNGRMPSKQTH